ncbi:hypothetical protein GCM10022276_20450 [Sphingomonas limnosediminicola]|jgi:CRP-like cAMP-binding protein|uniref:HTH crp-type domain-containing protein n=1 Tax=Sphingomonas limnosediminicola TaxID=940133 RepID=A0ABP7LGU3_9SPHN
MDKINGYPRGDRILSATLNGSREAEWVELLQKRLGRNSLGLIERSELAEAYQRTQIFRRGQTIVDHADGQSLHILIEGWAARTNILEDGSQQITDIILPGDFCDLSRLTGGTSMRAVAITSGRVALLDRKALLGVIERQPKLGLALIRLALSEQSILREWLTCTGRRDKRQHLAHLLCELHQRLRQVGLADGDEFDFPLTQSQLADATGMTPIYVNRLLQGLRDKGILSLEQHYLSIHEPRRLREIGGFSGSYLAD